MSMTHIKTNTHISPIQTNPSRNLSVPTASFVQQTLQNPKTLQLLC